MKWMQWSINAILTGLLDKHRDVIMFSVIPDCLNCPYAAEAPHVSSNKSMLNCILQILYCLRCESALSVAVAFSLSVSLEMWWVVVLYDDRRLVVSPDCGDRLTHTDSHSSAALQQHLLESAWTYTQHTLSLNSRRICNTYWIINICFLTSANPNIRKPESWCMYSTLLNVDLLSITYVGTYTYSYFICYLNMCVKIIIIKRQIHTMVNIYCNVIRSWMRVIQGHREREAAVEGRHNNDYWKEWILELYQMFFCMCFYIQIKSNHWKHNKVLKPNRT